MTLSKAIKSATLFSVMVLGIQGSAFANDGKSGRSAAGGGPHVKVFDGSSRSGHTGGHILFGDGSVRFNTAGEQARTKGPVPKPADKLSNETPDPQPIGLLLPAIQKVR